jgi:hypothetical protein
MFLYNKQSFYWLINAKKLLVEERKKASSQRKQSIDKELRKIIEALRN